MRVVITGVLLLVSWACGEPASKVPALRMVAERTIGLPDSIIPRAAGFGLGGQIVGVTQHGRGFIMDSGGRLSWPSDCPQGPWIAIRGLRAHGALGVEGIVDDPPRLRTCTRHTVHETQVPGQDSVEQAGWDGLQWVTLRRESRDEFRIVRISTLPQGDQLTVDSVWSTKVTGPNQDLYAFTFDGITIAGEVRSPFRAWALQSKARPLQLQPPPELLDSLTTGVARGRWVSLSTFALDVGFVQHFADLTGDARYLLLYNGSGAPARFLRIEAPFGILAVDVAARRLLAFRRLTRHELIVYRWEWLPLPRESW